MKKKLILITCNNDFFGQTRKPWVSMDVSKIITTLEKNSIIVEKHSFNEIVNGDFSFKDEVIFYSFSQKENVRFYVKDIMQYLSRDNKVIPSVDLLLCHENKGFQELVKKRIGLKSLWAFYFSSVKELDFYKIDFPLVLKKTDGSNGKGVYLAENRKQLVSLVNRLAKTGISTKLDLIRRKYFRRKKVYKEYPDYTNRKDHYQYKDYITIESNFIIQEYIPNLTYDYRVLALYDKYYVIKRHIRKNDFRASGAKKFDRNFKVDESLLNYSKKVYNYFQSPFMSIDILFDGQRYYLAEFQALHFGLNVFVKSEGYYKYCGNKWEFFKTENDIETELGKALANYLNKRVF